jgi:hypothetical protein
MIVRMRVMRTMSPIGLVIVPDVGEELHQGMMA